MNRFEFVLEYARSLSDRDSLRKGLNLAQRLLSATEENSFENVHLMMAASFIKAFLRKSSSMSGITDKEFEKMCEITDSYIWQTCEDVPLPQE